MHPQRRLLYFRQFTDDPRQVRGGQAPDDDSNGLAETTWGSKVNINCKHCGHVVEIEDLLAAAEQPCPHCSLPLLDDRPMPPSSPRPAGGCTARLIRWAKLLAKISDWFNGTGILITPEEAMCTPPGVCVVCGAAATDVLEGAVQRPNHFGLLFWHIKLPYCPRHYRAERQAWRSIRIPILVLLSTMVAAGLICWARPNLLEELGIPLAPSTFWLFFMLGEFVVFGLLRLRSDSVFCIASGKCIDVQGASPQYICAMQELRTRRRIDGL